MKIISHKSNHNHKTIYSKSSHSWAEAGKFQDYFVSGMHADADAAAMVLIMSDKRSRIKYFISLSKNANAILCVLKTV